jgi:hypothetical protein
LHERVSEHFLAAQLEARRRLGHLAIIGRPLAHGFDD